MKTLILTILRTGYTTTKKFSLADIIGYCYPLKNLLKVDNGLIQCNDNEFWKPENNINRHQLINDFRDWKRSMLKGSKFTILNRFENGDGYGIVRDDRGVKC